MVVIWQNWLCSNNLVAFGQIGCIRARWLYLGKNGCIRANWLYLGKNGCIRANCLYSGKVFVIGQDGLFVQNGCVRSRWLYLAKIVVFG